MPISDRFLRGLKTHSFSRSWGTKITWGIGCLFSAGRQMLSYHRQGFNISRHRNTWKAEESAFITLRILRSLRKRARSQVPTKMISSRWVETISCVRNHGRLRLKSWECLHQRRVIVGRAVHLSQFRSSGIWSFRASRVKLNPLHQRAANPNSLREPIKIPLSK